MPIVLVDSTTALQKCLAAIRRDAQADIAVDIEGINLCRDGRMSIIQLFVRGSDTVWLVDVTTLGARAFDEAHEGEGCLRQIFESPSRKKYFYDVRNDADAMFNLYGVSLANTYDLQLLELASRSSLGRSTKFLNGLKRCIGDYLGNPRNWNRSKEAGLALFSPAHGGSYDVFEQRPLDPRLVTYCAQDVLLLFQLEAVLLARMGYRGSNWDLRITRESAARVKAARSPTFNGKGAHMAMAPIGW